MIRLASGPLLVLAVAACASNPAPSGSTATDRPAPSATTPSSSPDASAAATCDVDLTVTGDVTGHVTGLIEAAPRRLGRDGHGISIDTFLNLSYDGAPKRFLFSVFDPDGGTGPEGVAALFGGIDAAPLPQGWQADTDKGRATIAPDGSAADIDILLDHGLGPDVEIAGTFACPPVSSDGQITRAAPSRAGRTAPLS